MRADAERTGICFYSPHATSLFDEMSPGGHGGAELVMFYLACAMSRQPRFVVHFLLKSLPVRRVDDCAVKVHVIEKSVARGEGPRFISVFTNAVRGVRPFLRTGARVYVLCGASVTLGYVALLRQVLRRKRVVFIVASDADAQGALLRESPAERRLFGIGIRLADAVLCQNLGQQEAIAAIYGRESGLLPNGMPMSAGPPFAERRHILWVASCQALKQPHVYLDLAEAMPEERFVMIMPPRKDDALFVEIAARAQGMANVGFIEGVHFREIQRYFDEAKVFVNTSTIEGYPNTFVQAMIGATPILSLNVDPNGILTEHGLGRCAGGDPDRLLADLREFVEDEQMRRSIGDAAFGYAREHHDLEHVSAQFMEAIQDVLA